MTNQDDFSKTEPPVAEQFTSYANIYFYPPKDCKYLRWDLPPKKNDVSTQVQETSLERIERKLDLLTKEVATKEDLLKHTKAVLINQQNINSELQEKIQVLREMQINNISHKRLFRYAAMFSIFFSASYIFDVFFNTTIVVPFWNSVGLLLSFGFLFMSWMMGIDWKKYVGTRGE